MKKMISVFFIMTFFIISANAQTTVNRDLRVRNRPGTERRIHRRELRRIRRIERRHHHRRRIGFELNNDNNQQSLVVIYKSKSGIEG